jgi:hypothetical protein
VSRLTDCLSNSGIRLLTMGARVFDDGVRAAALALVV